MIVQRTLPHYRVPFFEMLRAKLEAEDVSLRLVVGAPSATEATRQDTGQLEWVERIENHEIPVGPRGLVWQPAIARTHGAELVVVEYASRLLANYVLAAWRRFGGPKLAFWGHGHNHDGANASSLGEVGKRRLASQTDWWFCYTEGTARVVESLGVDRRKMTIVQNTTDTESLRRARLAMGAQDVAAVRASLGIGDGPVAVSIGSIYAAKRPEFLLDAADHLRRTTPGFELIVIGDGPDRQVLDSAARSRPWLHVLGAVHGDAVARWASPASLLLNPGVVGLTIVDSFALGLPMVTCDITGHGPEVEYLEHGVNGLMLVGDTTPQQYAEEVARVLDDPNELANLSYHAAEAAGRYTMVEMVERFADGILAALSAPRADARIIPTVRRRRRPWAS